MKRCVVNFRDGGFCNIEANMISRDDDILLVFKGTELVGMFDMGFVNAVYLTEKGGS